MIRIKRLFTLLTITLMAIGAWAQSNGSNSSYSRFGVGILNDQSQGFNRGMAGVAQGYQSGTQVNMLNPASYSAIDSLTFIFDAGMGLQVGRLKGNGTSVRAMNTTLEYINAGMRLTKGLGMSLGFVPYSTIGYNFNESHRVGTNYTTGQTISSSTTYYGNGGLHELYLGLGWNPFAGLSIGANIGYLWGDYNHSLAQLFYEGSAQSLTYNAQNEEWGSDLKTYKLDIGAQYPIQLNKENVLSLGVTYSLGHNVGSKVTQIRYTSKGDTIKNEVTKAFDLPHTISAGLTWQRWKELGEGQRTRMLTLGADYSLQRWSGCKVPMSHSTLEGSSIEISTTQYNNMHRAAAGADYIHDRYGKYHQRMHYRVGASYATSYVKVNGHDGPKEYRLTAGVGLPLKTNTRSLINVSFEWLRRSPSTGSHITENYFMAHIGVTFNEQWFMKFRFQ